jgi:hypothetical protein
MFSPEGKLAEPSSPMCELREAGLKARLKATLCPSCKVAIKFCTCPKDGGAS